MSNIFYNKSHIYLSILYISDFFLLRGLLCQWDFIFLLSFFLFPVGSDGAFRPHFAPRAMFSISP